MKYQVTVGDRTVEVVVDGSHVRVDGRPFEAHVRPVAGTPLWRLEIDGRTWLVPVEPGEGGRSIATQDGTRVEFEAVDERTAHIRTLAAAAQGPVGAAVLRAPMPGLVVRVPVAVGQTVAAGQGVLVLEAMKMENELKAPSAAVVVAVHAAPGQAVEKGAVLVELGPVPPTG